MSHPPPPPPSMSSVQPPPLQVPTPSDTVPQSFVRRTRKRATLPVTPHLLHKTTSRNDNPLLRCLHTVRSTSNLNCIPTYDILLRRCTRPMLRLLPVRTTGRLLTLFRRQLRQDMRHRRVSRRMRHRPSRIISPRIISPRVHRHRILRKIPWSCTDSSAALWAFVDRIRRLDSAV